MRAIVLAAALVASLPAESDVGTLSREWVEGDYRFCQYRDGVSVWVERVHVSQPCPINSTL